MKPAPALDCAACARTIGKRSGHNLTDDGRMLHPAVKGAGGVRVRRGIGLLSADEDDS